MEWASATWEGEWEEVEEVVVVVVCTTDCFV